MAGAVLTAWASVVIHGCQQWELPCDDTAGASCQDGSRIIAGYATPVFADKVVVWTGEEGLSLELPPGVAEAYRWGVVETTECNGDCVRRYSCVDLPGGGGHAYAGGPSSVSPDCFPVWSRASDTEIVFKAPELASGNPLNLGFFLLGDGRCYVFGASASYYDHLNCSSFDVDLIRVVDNVQNGNDAPVGMSAE